MRLVTEQNCHHVVDTFILRQHFVHRWTDICSPMYSLIIICWKDASVKDWHCTFACPASSFNITSVPFIVTQKKRNKTYVVIHNIHAKFLSLFQLSRSGNFATTGDGKRRPKSQGSCRTGSLCTAHIRVTQTRGGGVSVKFCPVHQHEEEPEHIRVPRSLQLEIAGITE